MILKEILEKTTRFFKDKQIETARLDAEMLIANALKLRRIELYLKFEQPLQDIEVDTCREFVRRRSQGEPVAYILGQRDFYNLTFKVDSRVLIPRPETEQLVETVLIDMKARTQDSFRVLDLGCGSGCIGLAIAHHEKRSSVVLVDAAGGAIDVTKINCINLELEDSCEVVHCNALEVDFEDNSFDYILANPPYISSDDPEIQENVKKYEPRSALFAERDGLADVFDWSTKFASNLKLGGTMIFEIGYKQGELVKAHFEELKIFKQVKILKDLSGLDRFVIGKK